MRIKAWLSLASLYNDLACALKCQLPADRMLLELRQDAEWVSDAVGNGRLWLFSRETQSYPDAVSRTPLLVLSSCMKLCG